MRCSLARGGRVSKDHRSIILVAGTARSSRSGRGVSPFGVPQLFRCASLQTRNGPEVDNLGWTDVGIVHISTRYGYMESPDVPSPPAGPQDRPDLDRGA